MEKMLGVYIHIPFCKSKCAYCDFYSLPGCEDKMPDYHRALIAHIKEAAPQLDGYITDTIYFGGGTPSYYGADRLIEIFETLKKAGNVLIGTEVTAEVNPATVTYQELVKMRRAGFNRLSIGVQSANNGMLKSLGRLHTFEDAERTLLDARRAGFENVGFDLIYGLPSQTREDWADTLTRAAALKPEHFSCYGLKIEEGTRLWEYRDAPFFPDDDTQADMYLYTVEQLERYGYHQYEVSNFAQRGFESQHNLKYWMGGEYMGFGCGAHSCLGNQRFSYIADIDKYIERILGGGTVVDQQEVITPFERAGEYLMLGLRTTHGITEKEYTDIYSCKFDLSRELLQMFKKNGWAEQNGERWRLTPKGFLVSNTLIGAILEAQKRQRAGELTPWKKIDTEADNQYSIFDMESPEVSLFNGIT